MPDKEKPKAAKKKTGKAGFIAAIIINLIFLFIFNSLPNWHVSFLTSAYSGILWAINLSIGATIIANILFLVYGTGWFRHLVQLILNIIALFVIYLIYAVFPFNFTGAAWDHWVKIILIILMACLGIATIVELVKFLRRKD